jgi:hypothetical protein
MTDTCKQVLVWLAMDSCAPGSVDIRGIEYFTDLMTLGITYNITILTSPG